MAIFVSLPVFIGLTVLQSGILSHMRLLDGPVDLTLLVIVSWSLQERVKSPLSWALSGGLIASLGTALPFGTLIGIYIMVSGLCLYLKRVIWKVPAFAMLSATFLGTIMVYFISYLVISLNGDFLPILDVMNLVVLPSLLLNILAALPVHFLVSDLANWIYPED
jgi:hypothetical protein